MGIFLGSDPVAVTKLGTRVVGDKTFLAVFFQVASLKDQSHRTETETVLITETLGIVDMHISCRFLSLVLFLTPHQLRHITHFVKMHLEGSLKQLTSRNNHLVLTNFCSTLATHL